MDANPTDDAMKQVSGGNDAEVWVREGQLRHHARTYWPDKLVQATEDVWDFTIGLKDGTVIEFQSASPIASGQWIHLHACSRVYGGPFEHQLMIRDLGRGLEVRVDEIVWVSSRSS